MKEWVADMVVVGKAPGKVSVLILSSVISLADCLIISLWETLKFDSTIEFLLLDCTAAMFGPCFGFLYKNPMVKLKSKETLLFVSLTTLPIILFGSFYFRLL
jgi:hypothetical protein